MKTSLLLTCLLALVLFQSDSIAQTFLSKRDNATPTNCVVVFPGQSGKQAILRTLDVTGDNADAVVQYAVGVYQTRLSAAEASNSTALNVVATNVVTSAPGLLIIQRSTGVCTAHFYTSVAGGTVNTAAAIGTAASAGDAVWWATHLGTNSVGNATVRRDGSLWVAQQRAPLAVRLYTAAGSAERINNATVEYVPY